MNLYPEPNKNKNILLFEDHRVIYGLAMMTENFCLDSIDLCIFLCIHFRLRNKVSVSILEDS